MQILVGCDPEIFVKQNGKFVSAHALIPGNKQHPHKVERGAVQVDGMALEFNIDPAHTENEFVMNIQTVMAKLKEMCPNYELVATPVADFSLDYIRSQPEEARELGCEPDFSAYSGVANIKPNAELPMRTASGHVHIGWGNGFDVNSAEHDARCRAVSQQMDLFLGIPSLFYDADQRRREMYGKAGCYRLKSYGCEYRTLSNAWLLTPERMAWVYRQVQAGMKALMGGFMASQEVQNLERIINTGDKQSAEKLVNQYKLEICA